jgi:FtsP/CotA-like multicopper oxidase with cupredoxin domain
MTSRTRVRFDGYSTRGCRPVRASCCPASRPRPGGANRTHLDPTLCATNSDRWAINVRNDLSVATIIHWRGTHLPTEGAGGPHHM